MKNILALVLNKLREEKNSDNAEKDEIIKTVDSLKDELNQIQCRLNYTTEPLLIESVIYEIKAIQKKYEFYIKICKEKGFAAKGFGKLS